MTRIHFLLTQDLESPSGLGRYWPMANELSKLGHIVSISALHGNFNRLLAKKSMKENVKIEYVSQMHVVKKESGKKYLPFPLFIYVVIKATFLLTLAALKSDADILVVGKPQPMNGIAGVIATYIKKTRLIVDCDDYESGVNRFKNGWQKKIVEYFEKYLPRIADVVTTNTFFTRDRLIKEGIPVEKIVYISNGIDPNRFLPVDSKAVKNLRNNLRIPNGAVIGFVGTLGTTSHPLDLLVNGFAKVKSKIDNAFLLLVGGGEDVEVLKRLVLGKGIEDKVFFTGRVPSDQVSLYYSLMDISVDPIKNDNAALGRSPLKLFESWACGAPFITGDVGDRRLLCGEPPAALIVEPGSDEALANGIMYLLINRDEAQKLKRAGLEKISEYYWPTIIDQVKNIFDMEPNV